MVVPNGVLFGDGVCARIKEDLLKEFNLHTIVRLPNGVFAPYTGIPTNLLSLTAPAQRKRCGTTNSLCGRPQELHEDSFDSVRGVFRLSGVVEKREENERAWRIPVAELLANGCNLDRKNPRHKQDIAHLPPAQIAANILQKEHRIAEIIGKVSKLLAKQDL